MHSDGVLHKEVNAIHQISIAMDLIQRNKRVLEK
jgi:hypothetical protein